MVRELQNRLFLTIIIISMLVLITGCTGQTGANSQRKYYTGYDSVEMRFLEDSPPSIFYYDSEADFTIKSEANTIPIFVELYNKGSANTYGALFVHGFDPSLVAVQGYTNNYPGFTSIGQYRPISSWNGWYGNNDNWAIGGFQIPIGNNYIDFSLANVGGRKMISFGALGFNDRSGLFNRMGFTTGISRYGVGYSPISADIVNAPIGAVLNPITMGMFKSFGWESWLKTFQLEGRNRNNPGGGMDVIEFPATMYGLPPSLEEFPQPIYITSCFDYATHASTMVCIDPEPYSNVKKACRPTTVSLAGGQGAPVAITTIEQRPGKGRTTFVINVHHTKKNTYDELYDYWNLYKCDPASGAMVKSTDKNIVYIGYVYLSDLDITMSCIPDQVIRLDESGNGQITCSVDFPLGMASSAYKAPMEIELWYGYSKTIFRNIIIKRI